jgi:hypothetical protein
MNHDDGVRERLAWWWDCGGAAHRGISGSHGLIGSL